jgi:hypothetical protein
MKEIKQMTVEQLIREFATIALDQDQAISFDDNTRFNLLYDRMGVVEKELKSRVGDQRRALLHLYDHPNAQVRLTAARATLAVAPEAARRLLQSIADSKVGPQAGDAGMSLYNLGRGIYKPT